MHKAPFDGWQPRDASLASPALMKRLVVLFAAVVLGFTACEQHKKEKLPAEFQEHGDAKKEAPAPAEKAAPEAPKH